MIFGRTHEARRVAAREKIGIHYTWVPRRLEDGRWAWLELVGLAYSWKTQQGTGCWVYRSMRAPPQKHCDNAGCEHQGPPGSWY